MKAWNRCCREVNGRPSRPQRDLLYKVSPGRFQSQRASRVILDSVFLIAVANRPYGICATVKRVESQIHVDLTLQSGADLAHNRQTRAFGSWHLVCTKAGIPHTRRSCTDYLNICASPDSQCHCSLHKSGRYP